MILHPAAQAAVHYVAVNVTDDVAAFAVGMALATRTGPEGLSIAGARTLAKIGLNKDSVVAAVRRLEAAGHLLVERRGNGRGSVYRISTTVPSDRTPVPSDRTVGIVRSDRTTVPSDRTPVPSGRTVAPAAAFSMRRVEKSSSSAAALKPHAVEALRLLEPFVESEIERKKPTNRVGYGCTIKDAIMRDLSTLQGQHATARELACACRPSAHLEDERTSVQERMNVAWNMPPPPDPPPDEGEFVTDPVERHRIAAAARAKMAGEHAELLAKMEREQAKPDYTPLNKWSIRKP